MDETYNTEIRNIQSILEGKQLNLINQLSEEFGQRKIPFEDFKTQVSIGYGYMLTLPELETSMNEVIDDINSQATEDDANISLDNIAPKSWRPEDPDLDEKISQFTDVLSQSVEKCKKSYRK
jgi:hypothetical protein